MFVEQRDATWWFKLNGAARLAIARGALNRISPPVVVTEYPKSGGTWLSQMLSAAIGVPYPRNRLPLLKPQIIHGCYQKVHANTDTIVVWRDGRDIMVSFYYHLMFEKPITSSKYSNNLKRDLRISDPHDIKTNLARFVRWSFEGGYPGYAWSDFVKTWHGDTRCYQTSYEAILLDPQSELENVLKYLSVYNCSQTDIESIVHQFSFENQSSRQPGEEDVSAFVRKGIVGDWKEKFSQEAKEVFASFAGRELILLGYESNNEWVRS